ncbi:UDP-glycosyltransferase 92A1-like [Diospyros lotus]|uniref:UDP-glycosyltransferase 92A1-like n=1 Tax=Diospyros lotus TaxID=55363 RepID=UPI0022550E11|nr:UDP-glycosyltransferase 92A1-like [Diospyros lotus]XP_052206137.1 UDP-glycosyltransferase 92A1-like [Diospyros lotus]
MSGSQQEHILMLPFMAQGHLIPFLQLARQIHHASGFTITIASTSLNVAYLSSVIAKDPVLASAQSRHQICLAAFPFNGSDFGLPPNTENTEALSLSQVLHLLHASATLEVPCRQLVSEITAKEGKPPICIISDVFHGWANCVAESFQTVNVTFCTCGAYGIAAYVSVWQNLPHRSVGDDEFRIPGFPDSYRFHRSQMHGFLQGANGHDPWSRFNRPQLSLSLGSFGWLCNTAEEIEPLGMGVLRKYTKLPVWAAGPLLPAGLLTNSKTLSQHSGREAAISPQKCLEWLDLHPHGSVLYISFGSQNTINPTQMMELAKGLEDTGRPFIWVIRPPIGFDIKGELRAEWLPEGFEERMVERKQGLLVRGWAPQLEILSHKSTAAFLSHCGWNSAMESLSQGVPIISWPLAAEQAFNSKMMMEEMGVCIELSRGMQSPIAKEEVKRTIELVMDNKKGKGEEIKRKAGKIGELIKAALTEEGGDPKGSSLQAMDDFIATLVSR